MILLAAFILLAGAFGLVWLAAVARGRAIRFASIGALAFLSSIGAFWVGKKTEQKVILTQFYSGPKRELSKVFHDLDAMAENQDFARLSACVEILKEECDQSAFFIFEQNYGTHNYENIIEKIDRTKKPDQVSEPTTLAGAAHLRH